MTAALVRRLAKLEAARRAAVKPPEAVFIVPTGIDPETFWRDNRPANPAPWVFLIPDNGRDPPQQPDVSAS